MPDRPRSPHADRPFMPGYGIQPAVERPGGPGEGPMEEPEEGPEERSGGGSGLLPWSWAVERLERSHDFWLATVGPEGHPHVMPVWGVWLEGALWFSSAGASRKARNLRAHGRCAATTDDAHHPVVLEGDATEVEDDEAVGRFCAASNRKYQTAYEVAFYRENATFRLDPVWAFALDDANFTGTPTRWRFDPA